jgi:hypothetical protein
MALAKRQKGSLPEFFYGFNKAFGLFKLGPLPKINSSGVNSFYLFHAYYHQFQCNPFDLALCPFHSLSYKF